MTKYPTMEELINEARVREISYADIFEQDYYDTLDAREFFDKITEGKEQSYKDNAARRILLNKPGHRYYDMLLAWLSDGETQDKLEPVVVRWDDYGEEYSAMDGRHRAMFCIMLGIDDLPFVWDNRE